MGLDMYLTRRVYVGNNFKNENERVVRVPNKDNEQQIDESRITEVVENVGYWRKANAIHAWFVRNVQDGVDECQPTYVPQEKLEELLDVCKKVMEDRSLAPSLLPSQDGFFFGGTEYDEYYYGDVEETISILTNALKLLEVDGAIYYRSSW